MYRIIINVCIIFHVTVHEKIEILNEKLELATGSDKFVEGQDGSEAGAVNWKAGAKKCKLVCYDQRQKKRQKMWSVLLSINEY